MLKNSDKNKVENYIQKIIDGLLDDTNKSIISGMGDKQVIDRITKATVNKISHESKMIISSVYNMLMNDTLSEDFFQEPSNKALFYELNILKKINNKFNFEVPTHINYKESKKELDTLIKAGNITIVTIGGIVSIKFKSFFPIGISVIIALAITFGIILLNNKTNNKSNINNIIFEYLNGIKKGLLAWIKTIEIYYDEQIEELKKGMNA